MPDSEEAFYDLTSDAMDNENLYLMSYDVSQFYVFDQNGQFQGSHEMRKRIHSLATTSGHLMVAQGWKPDTLDHSVGRIICLSVGNYQELWRYETTKGGFIYAPPIIKNGVYYNGTAEGPGEFVALDAATGKVKWKVPNLMCWRFTLGEDAAYVNNGSGMVTSIMPITVDCISGMPKPVNA